MEYKKSDNPQFDYVVQEIQNQLNRIRNGRWAYITPDGLFGPKTEQAVIAYQNSKGITPASGIVGDTTYGYLMNESYLVIQAASPQYYIGPNTSAYKGNYTPLPGEKAIDYGVMIPSATVNSKAIFDLSDEKSIGSMVTQVQKTIQQQIDNLNRRIAKIPAKKQMRVRNLNKHLVKANEFIAKAKKYGIPVAATESFGQVTKQSAIKYMGDMAEIIKDCKITAFWTQAAAFFKKLGKILKPVYDFLNQFPGLKYLGAMEKIGKGIWQLIHLNCDTAFGLFLDGIREIVESLLVDLIVGFVIALGGWIAILLVVVILLVVFVVDYFFFSDNAGESLVDQHTNLRTQNVIQDTVAPWIYNKVY